MAQLPPKFPSSAASPWLAEEFFDFSSTKRGAHRRVMSDSGTTFEDELLQNSMFSEDVRMPSSGPASAAPSTPSDHNSSINEQADMLAPPSSGNDLAEVQSACNAMDSAHVDPKRVRRILANRQSAQRSRVRKLQYISELERSVTTLQTEVSALSPRVAFLDQQRTVLSVGNSNLKQRIAALAYDNLFKDARQEMLQHELERLRKLYHHQQNLKKLPAVAADYDPSSEP